MMQASKAVAFLHAQQPPYVHCDIKSPNYLVTDQWVVRLADFGSAALADEGGGAEEDDYLLDENDDEECDTDASMLHESYAQLAPASAPPSPALGTRRKRAKSGNKGSGTSLTLGSVGTQSMPSVSTSVHRRSASGSMLWMPPERASKMYEIFDGGDSDGEGKGDQSGSGGAPELAGRALKPLSTAQLALKGDVYALAMTLWEVASRKEPFANVSTFKVGKMVLDGERPAIDETTCPPAFARLVRKGWAQQPELRPTAEEIVSALEAMRGIDIC
jgi:serine/threonine protein kinase